MRTTKRILRGIRMAFAVIITAGAFIWFEHSAHNMQYEEPDKFIQEIIRLAEEVLNSSR